MNHRAVQQIARDTIAYIKTQITPGMPLGRVRELCEAHMLGLGADSFWYYDIGAFVFSGDETAVSVSGRDYVTSDRVIGENDIVTIDLSPQCADIWGDFARTVILENGHVVNGTDTVQNAEWRAGLQMEARLHKELLAFAAPETTFEALYLHMNRLISEAGFVNLDFLSNLGIPSSARRQTAYILRRAIMRRFRLCGISPLSRISAYRSPNTDTRWRIFTAFPAAGLRNCENPALTFPETLSKRA